VSLIFGVLWLLWIGSIAAVVTGHLARRQVRELGYGGDTLAVFGLVLGYIGLATFGLFVALPWLFGVYSQS
jgi:hypothetical protein